MMATRVGRLRWTAGQGQRAGGHCVVRHRHLRHWCTRCVHQGVNVRRLDQGQHTVDTQLIHITRKCVPTSVQSRCKYIEQVPKVCGSMNRLGWVIIGRWRHLRLQPQMRGYGFDFHIFVSNVRACRKPHACQRRVTCAWHVCAVIGRTHQRPCQIMN